MRYAYHAAQLK